MLQQIQSNDQRLILFVVAAICVWISTIDFSTYIVPDLAILLLVLCMTMQAFTLDEQILAGRFVQASIAYLLFWLIGEYIFQKHSVDGLGHGDAKIIGAATIGLGLTMIPWLILFSSLGGVFYYYIRRALRKKFTQEIPFAPFILFTMFVLFGIEE